jgi:molybdopterin molybdotransferase
VLDDIRRRKHAQFVPPERDLADLTEIEQARELVLERAAPLPVEEVGIGGALGRVLAEAVTSADPVPGFDNSAMDGFAVRAEDTGGAAPETPIALRVVDESRAGGPAASAVGPGEAIAISTGAMLPKGADAVVRVEDTDRDGERVAIQVEVETGRDIRRAGEDILPGSEVLPSGAVLGPAELGVLASVGREKARCFRRPALSIVTTGDELTEPGTPLGPGAIRNTNSYSIAALATLAGAEIATVATVGDDASATREALDEALGADVAVVCGGVSVGEHDHVRPVLAELGAEQVFWGLALRPGRPTWFGTRAGEQADGRTLVFGLPGNPVSAIVTFLLFVRPSLSAMQGADPARHLTRATLDSDYEKRPGRAHAVRCRLELREDGWHAQPTGAQGSHILTSMLGADGLALIPTASEGVRAGEKVDVELLPRL